MSSALNFLRRLFLDARRGGTWRIRLGQNEPRRSRSAEHGPFFTQVIKDYVAFTNESLRAAVKEYFEDKAAAERRHGKMNTWDVGRVTDMSQLFWLRRDFDDPGISAWDTSSVTTMVGFYCCHAWDGDIGAWETRSVEDFPPCKSIAMVYAGGIF